MKYELTEQSVQFTFGVEKASLLFLMLSQVTN